MACEVPFAGMTGGHREMSRMFDFIDDHERDCEYRRAAIAGVTYECEHGHQVCPVCDPCTCERPQISLLPPVTMPFGTGQRAPGTRDGEKTIDWGAGIRH
jgi:hypothetical protein